MVNELGEVAIRWNVLTPKQVNLGTKTYYFNIKMDISLCWVKPEDIDKILAVRVSCCGGTMNQSCHLANELDVKRWLGISIW
ncbi:MAG: hypothetical protein WC243_04325 [Patescibacteria group bacterium]|jgi:hypothetical protein